MKEKIKLYIDQIFIGAVKSKRTDDIREELTANCFAKYDDLIANGKSEDDAFTQVVSGIGDIHALLGEIRQDAEYDASNAIFTKQRRGLFISIGVALYILSFAILIIFSEMDYDMLGFFLMLTVVALATAMVIYGNYIGKNIYSKSDNTFVEEYKEKKSVQNRNNALIKSMSSSLWALTVLIYLAFSFITHKWHISWIIFIVAAVFQQIIAYLMSDSVKRKKLWHGILWTTVVVIYFLISFSFNAWAWSWMLFIAGVAVEQIIRLFIVYKETAEVKEI